MKEIEEELYTPERVAAWLFQLYVDDSRAEDFALTFVCLDELIRNKGDQSKYKKETRVALMNVNEIWLDIWMKLESVRLDNLDDILEKIIDFRENLKMDQGGQDENEKR
ncbi:hypothetical protein SAMN02910456_01189 [Ruminococcaceae bacterium YRB3002]|nr:hypothetical protein SAMN02910456_01189 [Ruminococcaceae bacterium YRB3002]